MKAPEKWTSDWSARHRREPGRDLQGSDEAAQRGIVIDDGGFTKQRVRHDESADQRLLPGLDRAPAAKMTHIVGDGRPICRKSVRLDGRLIATNPFASTAGPKWDTPTFPQRAAAAGSRLGDRAGGAPTACSPTACRASAMVFSTTVQDTTATACSTSGSRRTSASIGSERPAAAESQRDGRGPVPEGSLRRDRLHDDDRRPLYGGVAKPAHSHLPTQEALKLVGDAFRNAPIVNPDASTGSTCISTSGATIRQATPTPYIIPAQAWRAAARPSTNRSPSATAARPTRHGCASSRIIPGTVGWKTGFRFIRDEVLSGEPPPLSERETL